MSESTPPSNPPAFGSAIPSSLPATSPTNIPLPEEQPVAPTSTPATPTPSKKFKSFPKKAVMGALVLLLLAFGAVSAFFLSQDSADIRQQASGGYTVAEICTVSGTCINGKYCLTPGQAPVVTDGRCGVGQTAPKNCNGGLEQGGLDHGQVHCHNTKSYVKCEDGVLSTGLSCSPTEYCHSITGCSPQLPAPYEGATGCTVDNVHYNPNQCITGVARRCMDDIVIPDVNCPVTVAAAQPTYPTCRSSQGLLGGRSGEDLSNATPCVLSQPLPGDDPDPYYECNPGYITMNNRCVQPLELGCSVSGQNYTSGQCIGTTGKKCINGNPNVTDNSCPQPPSLQVGCQVNGQNYTSGQCIGTTGRKCVNGNPNVQDSSCSEAVPLAVGCSVGGQTYNSGQCIGTTGRKCVNGNPNIQDSSCSEAVALAVGCSVGGQTYSSGQCIGNTGSRCNNGNPSVRDNTCPQPVATNTCLPGFTPTRPDSSWCAQVNEQNGCFRCILEVSQLPPQVSGTQTLTPPQFYYCWYTSSQCMYGFQSSVACEAGSYETYTACQASLPAPINGSTSTGNGSLTGATLEGG